MGRLLVLWPFCGLSERLNRNCRLSLFLPFLCDGSCRLGSWIRALLGCGPMRITWAWLRWLIWRLSTWISRVYWHRILISPLHSIQFHKSVPQQEKEYLWKKGYQFQWKNKGSKQFRRGNKRQGSSLNKESLKACGMNEDWGSTSRRGSKNLRKARSWRVKRIFQNKAP